MKITLDINTTKTIQFDIIFPVYIRNMDEYYCFFDSENDKKCIRLIDMSISKSISYFNDHQSLKKILETKHTEIINQKIFQDKMVEILKIMNGVIDEMHKTN